MMADNTTKDNHQLLKEVLDELVVHNPNIISTIVVSDDGLKVASGIPHQHDDDVSLVASNLMDTAKEFSQQLQQGRLNRVVLEGERRTTVVMRAGRRTVLVVSVPSDEKLGVLSLSMRQAAAKIAKIFT